MKVLFDQGTPVPLRKSLTEHDISTAFEMGWSALENGDLLSAGEDNGFELLVTTDKNLRYQQNLSERKIAIAVLMTTSWPRIRADLESVTAAIDAVPAGGYTEIEIS